jgi:hypothetical protein
MLRDKERAGGPTKQGKVKGVALVDSPTRVAPLTSAKDPPPYGAQHRQDALWKGESLGCDDHCPAKQEAGGNEALPPRWGQFKVGDGETEYQDENLVMISWNRPLPGVRLGELRKYFQERSTHS